MTKLLILKRALLGLTLISTQLFVSNLLAKEAVKEAVKKLSNIAISLKQQQTMGIVVAPLAGNSGQINAQVNQRLPGEIVVPIGQERVISAAQAGLVDSLNVAAGADVKKGQALGHITSPDLINLQREYLQARTQTRLAKNTYDRDTELFKDGIIAERRYLATQSSFDELKALLSQRRQALKLSGFDDASIARLDKTGEFSSGLTVFSPIDGQVLEQLVTVGQRIDTATPMFRIGRLNPLWLEIHAPVESLAAVSKGMLVKIPQYQAEGKIIAIIRNINKTDQTMRVRAEITKNADKLSPGQFVEAEVTPSVQAISSTSSSAHLSNTKQASPNQASQFSVPKSALVRQGVDSYIFIANATGFSPYKVNVISEQADKAVIVANFGGNFTGTEKVVITGTVAIKAAWIGTSVQ